MTRISSLRLGFAKYDNGRPTLNWGQHRFPREVLVADIRGDGGERGTALVWCRVPDGAAYLKAALSLLKETVCGRDALTPYEAGKACQAVASRPAMTRAASVIELALWDLAGNALGVPCYQLLGRKRASLPAYAISSDEFAFKADSQYVELAQRLTERGFQACKFHLTGNPRRDIAICEAIRNKVGDGITLMLDPAGRYDRPSALAVCTALSQLEFERIEDPMSPHDFAGYRWLSQRVSLTIAANDALQWSLRDCTEAVRDGMVQCLRSDPGRVGVASILSTAAVAEAHGAQIDMAALAPFGGVEACLHLGLSSTTARWFENHFADGIDEVPGISCGITVVDGEATANGEPGWGTTIDWKEFNRICEWVE